MTAEIRADVVVATEHINAPPEVVFCYFTDPALIIAWIGDDAELDPEPGGTFCLHMGRVTARGTYLIVEPPHRVVFTWGVPGSDDLPQAARSSKSTSPQSATPPLWCSPTEPSRRANSTSTARAGNTNSTAWRSRSPDADRVAEVPPGHRATKRNAAPGV